MNILFKQASLSLLLGAASGTLCWLGARYLPQNGLAFDAYPGAIFGLCLHALGIYIIGVKPLNKIVSVIIIVIASIISWRLSISLGHTGPVPFITSGLLGGGIISIALVIAWKLHKKILPIVTWVTIAGGGGGAIFHAIDATISQSSELWPLLLFIEWQATVMLGVTLAIHFHVKRQNNRF